MWSPGGSISAESQHPAHKKINGGPHLSARHQESRFNLIWAFFEWLEHEILEIWDFGKMSGSHFSKTNKTNVFEKIQFCPHPNSHCLPSMKVFHIYEKIDLEKLITTNPIWDFFTETFDLFSARPFKNLVFWPQSEGGRICVSWAHPRGPAWAHPLGPSLGPPTWAQLEPTHLDFQTPPALPDEFSNPDPGPSQRTQGWNTSARKPSLLIWPVRVPNKGS